MNKRTKIITSAAGAAAVSVAAAIVSNKITKALAGEAFDRNAPKSVDAVAQKKFDEFFASDTFKNAEPKIEKLLNEPTKQIEIEANDGTKLVGHYYSCENPKRIILAMHGWRSYWARDYGTSHEFLHETGNDVLYIEQRGQGNSGGDFMGFGLTERFDCLSWIDWLLNNTENLPIYLMGISMGASTVLMASGFKLNQRVHGIIADCGFTSANEILKYVTKSTLHLPYATRKREINSICKKKTSYSADEYTTLDALKENKTPVLFVHGTDDDFVPISMTYENYKACVAPKELFVVPGAKHGESYLLDKEGYETKVLQFFAKYDD